MAPIPVISGLLPAAAPAMLPVLVALSVADMPILLPKRV
jgi:hypothetical protein